MSNGYPPTVRLGLRRRICRLFWCHECHRTVRIISYPSSPIFCPRCFGLSLRELALPRPAYTTYLLHFRDPSPPPSPFLDSLSASLDLYDSLIVFRRTPEPRRSPPRIDPPLPPPTSEPEAGDDTGDYFTGPNLNELIEELTQEDRQGPPPASNRAIEAMARVSIPEERPGECPVCKEEFKAGEEAREMPCKHLYHSDCIVPWLRMHNSCPVCRYQLPEDSPAENGRRRRAGETAAVGGRDPSRWNPFSLLWPFRLGPSPGWGYQSHQPRQADDISGGSERDYTSWWRSWPFL